MIPQVMTDHPGWRTSRSGRLIRAMRSDANVWWIEQGVLTEPSPQYSTWQMPSYAPQVPAELTSALQQLGAVIRYRNHDLWDALTVAIIRQVVRADQARKLYALLCQKHGHRIEHNEDEAWLSPSPEEILRTGENLDKLGLKFYRPKLMSAAQAYLERSHYWRTLPSVQLLQELRSVPGIGPWTAGAAVADFTHDWSLYPYGDLAVRTWAKRAAPSVHWEPQEVHFAHQWAAIAGPNLSALTVLVLAYGGINGGQRPQ